MGTSDALFGTDGIRGRFNVEPITPSFAYHLGCVLAEHVQNPNAPVCVGCDTRQSSGLLQHYLITGFLDHGAKVDSLGVLPTPGIAFAIRHSSASLGVAVTASHNLFEYNGFKLFDSRGEKFNRAAEKHIESMLRQSSRRPFSDVSEIQCVPSVARQKYLAFLQARATRVGQTKLTGVIDCAHGATTTTAPEVIGLVLNDMHLIGNAPNGTNINAHVGSTALDTLQYRVQEIGADLGIAFDGDGDRVMFVDHEGSIIDGDQILFLLASHWFDGKSSGEGVVGTSMSNHGLSLALQERGVGFVRTDVGDKYVYHEMIKRQWRLGGEPSGHIICRNESHTGDGVLVALCVLEAMENSGRTLQQLVAPMQMLPQVQRSIQTSKPSELFERSSVKRIVADFDKRIESTGRILVRASGTESILRVMVEHADAESARNLADTLANEISKVA